MPIFDGSAAHFVDAINAAGIETQAASRRYLKVLKPVRVQDGRSLGELLPYDAGFRIATHAIGDRAVREVLSTPDAQKRFVEFGGAPKASSPKEMLDYVERETNKWRKLIEVRKIERL